MNSRKIFAATVLVVALPTPARPGAWRGLPPRGIS